MILPAVQLFGIALITRLLLLLLTPLMVVTSLVALVPLIDVSGLVAWKPRTGTTTFVTLPMETSS